MRAPVTPAPPSGLTSDEAARRHVACGPNVLPTSAPVPAWRQLAAQFVHFFALLLWGAGALAIVGGMPALGIAIFAVIVLNGVFAFAQEHRAERAAERLRALLPQRVVVVRDGVTTEVDASELVVGDRVVLAAGDRISADLVALECHGLRIDTSTLTGESAPTELGVGDSVFAGSFVVEGEAAAEVVAIASDTRLASIAQLTTSAKRKPTPLALELHRVVRTIAFVAVGVGISFFTLSMLLGTPAGDGFLFGVGVTVALVPEGLLPTVTLSLAVGAQRMARRGALVRHLEAVETLGSATFICTDKTGTLTQNRMTVVEVWTPAGKVAVTAAEDASAGGVVAPNPDARRALDDVALAAARASTGRVVQADGELIARGDPMEAAIVVLAARAGVDVAADERRASISRRFPFDSHRRRMSVVAGRRLLVKGAPDSVLPRCAPVTGADDVVDELSARGLRVLAVAARDVDGIGELADADAAERELELLGLLALEDPPRTHGAAAIAACRRAGIRVAMVTGDHPATALAIARETGLAAGDALVVEGADLPADDQILGALVDRDGIVIARVAPEDKLRIAHALRARGHVVAMTGDGVNDGPALREADIGIAMGRSGTDVAREAADMVLLDDDFATIVAAVEQGRSTFLNVRRFLTYHLSDNVAELTPFAVWALSGGRFPLALGVLQILALDLATDTLSAIALGTEPPKRDALSRPPVRGRLLSAMVARRSFGVLGPTEGLFGIAAFVATFVASGWLPGDPFPGGDVLLTASGATFLSVVIAQSANAFACRSSVVPPWRLGWFGNRFLVFAMAIELVVALGFLVIPPVAAQLDHLFPSAIGVLVALLAAPAVLAVDALDKKVRRGSQHT